MIRALIAAASPVVRAGLEALLARSASLAIVGTTSGDTLADDIEAHEPQVVLLAVEPRDNTLPNVVTQIALSPDAVPRTPAFVLLVDEPSLPWTADALRAGVRSVLPRNAMPDEIIAALEAAAAGLVTLPAELAIDLVSAPRGTATRPADPPTQPLTRRELEVLGFLAEGLANKNIAARLGISEHTVKTHVASILTKLDAFSRAEAVAIGARQGLILL
ncbi:MAG TPA: response regulator transcription factor [Gemmatimonadaceae bacterium]|nr:response regulator transcription factor [Gemmatimonadaceae bacterium]